MKDKAYCPTCRSLVDFETNYHIRTTELDGVEYEYPSKVAICNQCGDAASYNEYLEYNSRMFSDKVREVNNIVSLEIIRELPKLMNKTPEELSSILGLNPDSIGDIYTRFMNGLVPSKKISDNIKDMYVIYNT